MHVVRFNFFQTTLSAFQKNELQVTRQHDEFVWLHDVLEDTDEYAGIIVSSHLKLRLYLLLIYPRLSIFVIVACCKVQIIDCLQLVQYAIVHVSLPIPVFRVYCIYCTLYDRLIVKAHSQLHICVRPQNHVGLITCYHVRKNAKLLSNGRSWLVSSQRLLGICIKSSKF